MTINSSMVNALILERFAVENICIDTQCNPVKGCKSNHFNANDGGGDGQLKWAYPRRILKSCKSEQRFFWSNSRNQLCYIEDECSQQNLSHNNLNNTELVVHSIISNIRPIDWYDVHFSKLGKCKMFIDQFGDLYFINNNENRKIIVDKIKGVVKIIPLKEGVIVVGYSKSDADLLENAVILGHPLEKPTIITLNDTNDLFDLGFISKLEKLVIWASRDYPLILAYDQIKKNHSLYLYTYLSPGALVVDFFWEDPISEGVEPAKTVFISKSLFESNYIISYHIPSNLELRLVAISESNFKDICDGKSSSVEYQEPYVQTIKNVKDVVPIKLDEQHEKYRLFGIHYLYGLGHTKSNELFGQEELKELPTFSLILNSGKCLLYTGSWLITNVRFELEEAKDFELLSISSGVMNNFDALLQNGNNTIGVRCTMKLLPEDFLVQMLTGLLIKITPTDFSIGLFRDMITSQPSEHWNILCRSLLGVRKEIDSNELKNLSTHINGSIESPMSNGVHKKIKLFMDRDVCTNNKSRSWHEIKQFWIKYLEKNAKSPFDRAEFSNLTSKGIIPHDFLKQRYLKSANFLLMESQPLELSVSIQNIYILHALYEEIGLLPQFNAFENYQSRLMNDILIPLSIKLCLSNYYEHYQYLSSSFNFIKEIKENSTISYWDLPPILLDKLYLITKCSRLDKNDIYFKVINEHFPLQCFTVKLYEQLFNGSNRNETIDLISKSGITDAILPILSPVISLPIERFLNNYSINGLDLGLDDGMYLLLGRFDMLNCANNTNSPSRNNCFLKETENNSDSLVASVLPHGRNTADDQRNMLENLQAYYKNMLDPSKIISSEKRTVQERWKNDMKESPDLGLIELSYDWCFKVFSLDSRFCDVLEMLSLQNPPRILLQRSSGAYPIDEESWDEFQRQRVVDAVQLVYTSIMGRTACTFGGFEFDISLNKLNRPALVNKVYEVASNSLINIDIERFKEVCFDISMWNEFYMGLTQSLKYCSKKYKFKDDGFNKMKKSWLIEQLEIFSSQDDVPFISGFIYGISLNGFFKTGKTESITNFPLIIEPNEIYKILEDDGQSLKTCSILLAAAVSALKSQNDILLRLCLMHIPSVLPNMYTESLQVSNINQYSALSSIGLLFSQSRNRQVIEILFSEFLRTISDVDDQASNNPSLYSISAAISLGMVLQPNETSNNSQSDTTIENDINNVLLSCISGNNLPNVLSNLASGPNLEHYTEFSGLKRFKSQCENIEDKDTSKPTTNLTSESDKFSNSSKNHCSKIVDSTILGIPAALSLSIMHIRSKNKLISNSIAIPFDNPEELVNYRPEVLIFMSMAKIVIEWEENRTPNKDFIRSKIPKYLLYLPSDKIFPFPMTSNKISVPEPKVDTRLMHCVSVGTLDWIHCIQARMAILSGIIWGLGIVFAGKRSTDLKLITTTILEYLDKIPLIQMPLNIASTIRDHSICSSHITIDRWSKDLCIRVCLTTAAVCFSGSGDKQILKQIKYFREQLFEAAQLLWTSSTAVSPFSIFSIPPIEHVHSQLMAYNNALGFLFLSAGHYSFSNDNRLGSTFLLFATHPIYPKDSSDFNTPGIIFQPLRYLFIKAMDCGRKAIIPELVICSPEPKHNFNYSGAISDEKIYVPISIELKSNDFLFENKMEYYILPAILPDWEDIINIKVLGDRYYPISINLARDKNTNCFQRLLNGQLWVQCRSGGHGYNWSEANYVIKQIKRNPLSSIQLHRVLDDRVHKKQLFNRCEHFDKNLFTNTIANQYDEINDLYNDFLNTLVLEENKPSSRNNCDQSQPKKSNRKPWHGTIVNNYIDGILSTCNTINQDIGNLEMELSPEIIKTLRITLNLDNNSILHAILVNIHRRLQTRMSIIIRCLKYYYSGQLGPRTPSCDEKRSLRLFISLNGMPTSTHFNHVLRNKIEPNKKIATLLRDDYSKYEEIIIPILDREFPCLSSLGLQVLKVFAHEYIMKVQKMGSQALESQQQIKTMFNRIFSSNFF
ncbi:hypothetical protein OJ253_307 [Cryptosporidium canis]|uniref:Anaphase-promoting complex subunit 1 beta-sandwich domain-containing protein n=1 Tax=Cryptosporidium canis TaxID=195482 RepID=A0A9D5HZ10_9CRYT|nr:hypothetical protein OJ253_307 [Cryptosporidium canis]